MQRGSSKNFEKLGSAHHAVLDRTDLSGNLGHRPALGTHRLP